MHTILHPASIQEMKFEIAKNEPPHFSLLSTDFQKGVWNTDTLTKLEALHLGTCFMFVSGTIKSLRPIEANCLLKDYAKL